MRNYCQHLFNKSGDELKKTLLIDGNTGKNYTFEEVQVIVKKLSNFFVKKGYKPGDVVTMHIYNSPEAIFTHLAVQYCGLVSCFLDPLLKPSALDYYIDDTEAKCIVTHCNYSGNLDVINSNTIMDIVESEHINEEMYLYDEDDLAYIYYTSGTTSMPKGVCLTNKNLLNSLKIFYKQGYSYDNDDCLICFVPFSHGYGSITLLPPCLEKNLKLVIMRSFHPKLVADSIEKYGITRMYGVPSHYQQLLMAPAYYPQLRKLKSAFTAAALLNLETSKDWKDKVGFYLDEGFGLIETCTGLCFRIGSLPKKIGHVGSYASDLIEVEILDEDLNILEKGKRGEIAVRGVSVMKHYLNKPEENKRALREGWFLTGDIGYKLEDNSLVLTGRKKDIINIAGLKVCPFEIESVINAIPQVAESSVVGIKDTTYGEVVCAYVVLNEEITEREIIRYASTQLPTFQVPKRVEFLTEFPRNNMGKVDKKQLVKELV